MQLGTPEQFALHDVPEQLTRPLHEVIPVQFTFVSAALLVTSPAHARAPEQSTAHVAPVHVMACTQESGCLHRTSHDGELQTIGPVHVPAALQLTPHLLPLHVIRCVHAPAPTQSLLHTLAALQSIVPVHEPAPVQVTLHGMPAGQTTGSVQVPAATHAIAQVPFGSQVPTPASAQSEGHARTALITKASPASASELIASTAASPSTLAAPSASVVASLVAPSSPAPNVMSGKPHAAATRPLAARNGIEKSTARARVSLSNNATARKNGPAAPRAASPVLVGRRSSARSPSRHSRDTHAAVAAFRRSGRAK